MDKWDYRFISLAKFIAGWSKDPVTKVGAVITRGNRIISLGYNGFPANVDDSVELYHDRNIKLRRTIHAEVNAITFSKMDITDCNMYVTRHPCAQCMALIIQSGLRKVVYVKDEGFESRWRDDIIEASMMAVEANIRMVPYEDR